MDQYQPERWHDYFLATSGASAALAGLLFVAISLHIRYIATDPQYRGISGGALIGLVNVLVVSLVPLVAQPSGWLGPELVGIGAGSIAAGAAYQLAAIRRPYLTQPSTRDPGHPTRSAWRLGGWHVRRSNLQRSGLGYLLSLGGVVAGLSITFRVGPGLYILALILVVVLVWSLWDAWVLLLGIADEEMEAERTGP
jgi:modulator of FtsH protease